MKRHVVGLKWAARLTGRPGCISVGRARGIKALGVRYEKAFEKWIGPGEATRGVWFEFEDKNGHGYCQVDFLIRGEGEVFVLELKHTWNEGAHVELEKLYLPIVSLAMKAPAFGLVVAKRLTPESRRVKVVAGLEEGKAQARSARRVVFHWLGGVPVRASREVYRPHAVGLSGRVFLG